LLLTAPRINNGGENSGKGQRWQLTAKPEDKKYARRKYLEQPEHSLIALLSNG
jgi:hypothetical protein